MKKSYIIIGSSAAGISAYTTLSRLLPEALITCITQENTILYNTCYLAQYLAREKSKEDIALAYPAFDGYKKVLKTNTPVIAIDPKKQRISALVNEKEENFYYDSLLIATGSQIWIPESLGDWFKQLKGIFKFHTLSDIEAIKNYMCNFNIKRIAIVGTGFTGIECADAFVQRGLQVVLIEQKEHIFFSLLDAEAAWWLVRHSLLSTLEIYTQQTIRVCKSIDGRCAGIVLSSGQELEIDMLIYATGTRANNILAFQAGIATRDQGIITDNFMKANISEIFAAGDCALVQDRLTGDYVRNTLWADAVIQGIHAAYSMANNRKSYQGIIKNYASSFFNTQLALCGSLKATNILREVSDKHYKALYYENNILKGFVLLGNISERDKLRRAVLTGEVLEKII